MVRDYFKFSFVVKTILYIPIVIIINGNKVPLTYLSKTCQALLIAVSKYRIEI